MKSLILIASALLGVVVGCKQAPEVTSTSISTGSQPATPAKTVTKRPPQTVRITIKLQDDKVVADPDPAPKDSPVLSGGDTVEWTNMADGDLKIYLMDDDAIAGKYGKKKNPEVENPVPCNGKKCTLHIREHNHQDVRIYKYVAEIDCSGKGCPKVSDPDLEVSGASNMDVLVVTPPPRH